MLHLQHNKEDRKIILDAVGHEGRREGQQVTAESVQTSPLRVFSVPQALKLLYHTLNILYNKIVLYLLMP